MPILDVTSADQIDIRENVPLAPLTTLNVGGPARFFVRAETESQIVEGLEYARRYGLSIFVLGGGSNLVVSDSGFDGLVIQVALRGISATDPLITVGAGEDWDPFVAYCVERNLAGVECLSGIPGSVGGTPVQNVGAYGQEVSETIVLVRCVERSTGNIVELSNSECGFSYRTSIFNSTDRDRFLVSGVTYKLVEGGEPKIAYKDLREYFNDRRPTLRETRDAVLSIRRSKSMVIGAGDPNSMSAGSFFKNPIIPIEKLERLAIDVDVDSVPRFPAGEGKVKIPAAWLIELSGFSKGFRLGNAGISTRHSLALINLGNATASEILALKDKIQEGVQKKFDILLQPEPVFVGFDQ